MDALSLLLNRRSLPKMKAPAPQGEALEAIFQAGLRAPDHAGLTPWQFIVAKEHGLQRLADVLVAAGKANGADEAALKKLANAPFRAPMVITVVAKVTAHAKVPVSEQLISAGCAAHAMQMAAVTQGFTGFWRTGEYAYHPLVKSGLGLAEDDEIVGFLYLGTPDCQTAKVPVRESERFVSYL
uniref:NAD(P)H nitroreductase n=1 Tax=Thaumasiovibrio occultus TaxID=1891184 RepID=UPI000B364054|nr:NAD(P)H nitroreductase [Thaumasiovibrio occultus]